MCKLCGALSSTNYFSQMDEWVKRDAERIARMKSAGAQASVFSSIPFPPKIDFPLFEPLVQFSSPPHYYQGLAVDRLHLVNSWSHDFARAFGFSGGKLFMIAKAVDKQDNFLFYYLTEFEKGELEMSVDERNRISIAASNIQKIGSNLLTGAGEARAFDFEWQHNQTEQSFVSAERANTNPLLQRAGVRVPPNAEYVVTFPHFAPHPYLMNEHAKFGYKTRMEMQKDVGNLVASHLAQLTSNPRPKPPPQSNP